ncbi:conserved hypothetical protein [Neospora caninum Liverpool]|nr:conserved hypothetical protein [Neospora caninum Liverpool]CBZ50695.1 conserved hypothetical protein [Neospora caninum Liverpool]|eukprot:XP_003880728.1 conserved hypothetical protein [Neospora caninum Liverpool]
MTAETTADQDLGNRQPQRAEEPKPSRRGQIPGEDKPTIEGSPQRIWTSESPGFETTKSPLSTWNEQQGAFGVADSDIAAATAEALKKLLTRVKEQQASLGEEWRRYEELEYRRMRLLSAGGRNMGLADTHREGLREANAEFHRSLAYLQQTVDTLQKQMDTLSLGRLASRAALLGSADSPGWRSGDGRNSSEQSQPSFKDRLGRAQKNAGDARGHSTWAKQDRSEGRTSSTDLVFVQPTELLVVATRVHELLGHQQRLTDFLGSLVSLQSHRLLQQEWPLESQIRELQENNVSASVLPSRIRKARPQRVQWRTYRHAKYAAASRAEEARMTASVFGSFPGDNAFFGGRIGMNHHFHEVPVQPTSPQSVSVLGKPPRTVHGSSSASVQTKKEERPKGRRGVVGGFEVFDDPEETVTAALQRFLYPAYSLAFVANLVPGSGGRRTQGVGGLAEATVHGRMEWLTDSTVFADRKLNEIVEEKMTKRAARSGLPTTRFVPTAPGRDRPWNRNDATTETPVPAVLDAVRYAEKAASLTAFYDRVEQEGAEEAQKKPDVGTPQDIIFQYAFDNVPLEHKRALWKDYLQVQLEDRGYDILLPDESTEGQRNDDDTRRLAPDVGVLPPGMHSSVVENAADGPETSQFSQQPPVNPAVELSWLVEDAFGHADRRSSSTPTGLFQGLMDANLAREAQARSGNNALKLEIPTLNTKEWGALEYSGDTGNIIPFLKDDLVSRELLQEILLVQGGVGGEEGAVLGLDSWAFEESTENSDTDLLHDEDFDNNENLGWAWDFVL